MKPANWPRYMLAKRLNRTAYYWSPHKRDLKAGCTLKREALGFDYGAAIERAALLELTPTRPLLERSLARTGLSFGGNS
jgi:hypothetical protein